MTKADWIFVGLKLLGVYFAVHGAITLILLFAGFLLFLQQGKLGGPVAIDNIIVTWYKSLQLLQPVIHLVCAFLLIRRTDWCLGWIYFERQGQAEKDNDGLIR